MMNKPIKRSRLSSALTVATEAYDKKIPERGPQSGTGAHRNRFETKSMSSRTSHKQNASKAKTYQVESQIGFILRLAFQFHTAIFTDRMVHNLTQTQFATMAKIKQMGVCSQSDLVGLISLDSATINGVVSRMKARGFIGVSEDPSDRRRQLLELTRKGLEVMTQAEAIGQSITDETLEALTPTERSRLIKLLQKMIGNVTP
jgi:DNA-binding MarR family transcriptional regulator